MPKTSSKQRAYWRATRSRSSRFPHHFEQRHGGRSAHVVAGTLAQPRRIGQADRREHPLRVLDARRREHAGEAGTKRAARIFRKRRLRERSAQQYDAEVGVAARRRARGLDAAEHPLAQRQAGGAEHVCGTACARHKIVRRPSRARPRRSSRFRVSALRAPRCRPARPRRRPRWALHRRAGGCRKPRPGDRSSASSSGRPP